MEGFNQRLKKFRIRAGLSQKEAAKRIGVPESTYREWEYGRKIQGEPYVAIARVYGITLDELLGSKEVRSSSEPLNLDPLYKENIEQSFEKLTADMNLLKKKVQKILKGA